MKVLALFLAVTPLFAQYHFLATTDDGSVLYFTTALRIPGKGESLNEKLFRIDSRGVQLIDDEGQGGADADLHDPSVSGDGSRLVYTSTQFCNFGTPCAYDDFSKPKTPPGTPTLFPGDAKGGAAISPNGRYLVMYPRSLATSLGYQPALMDLATGIRTSLQETAYGLSNVLSTGAVAATISREGSYVSALLRVDGSVVILGNTATVSDDETTLAYVDLVASQLYVKATNGSPIAIGIPGNSNSPVQLSRDGTRILFLSGPQRAPQNLFFARTDGSGLHQLTQKPAGVREAVLSGDGKVAYAFANDGSLSKIDTATGNATQLIAPWSIPKFVGGGSPGSIVAATNLDLPLPSVTGTAPFSTELAGITIPVANIPAPIISISPTEIDFQDPLEAPASPYVANPGPGSPHDPLGPAVILPGAGPGFEAAFPIDFYTVYPLLLGLAPFDSANNYISVTVHQDGLRLVTFADPAVPGETVTMYGTGFGPVNPPLPNGVLSPANPLSRVTSPLQIAARVDNASGASQWLDLAYLGMAPGLVGMYQLNLQIPLSLPLNSQSRALVILGIGMPGTVGYALSGTIPLQIPAN